MDIRLTKSLKTPVSGKYARHMKCTISGSSVAFSAPLKTDIFLEDFVISHEKVDLCLSNGHVSKVQALLFGSQKHLLVSASEDSINVWDLNSTAETGPTYLTIAKNLGSVKCMSLSYDDQLVAVCISDEIWVIDVQSSELVTQLDISRKEVLCLEFCAVIENILVSLFHDSTYGIWNLEESKQIYQSSIISSFSIVSMATHPYQSLFATGSSDGMLRVYDVTLHQTLHSLNIQQAISKEHCFLLNPEECSITSIFYWNKELSDSKQFRTTGCQELYLVVGCCSNILVYNANSLDYLQSVQLRDILSNFSSALNIGFAHSHDNEEVFVMVLQEHHIHVLNISCIPEDEDLSLNLSHLSIEPLVENSPLKSEMIEKPKQVMKKAGSRRELKNQAVVFHSKIVSSGYAINKPPTKMFKPTVKKTKEKTKESRSAKNPVGPWGGKCDPRKTPARDFPLDGGPPIKHANDVRLSKVNIKDMNISDTGRSLLCALSDGTVLLAKTEKLGDNIKSFIGHNHSANTVCMAHSNSLFLSASSDNTVKLWSPSSSDAIMNMTHCKHNLQQDKLKPETQKSNARFENGILKASFFFVDKFILLIHGNTLGLYKYHVQLLKDDIKRYQSNNKYKLVKDFHIEDVQNITTFSAINSFYSYTVICACSNRDMVLFDMNRGVQLHTISDAHSRPIFSIRQNEGSSYISLPRESYDQFITAAPGDGVKLWDLRTMKCSRKYEGHVNRAQNIGLACSPCSRYIAVGSEDKAVYIYDVRWNSYIHCLNGHSDIVSALCFNPKEPALLCGTLDGNIKCYNRDVID